MIRFETSNLSVLFDLPLPYPQSFKVERVPGNHIDVQGRMDPRLVPAVGTIIQNHSQELGYDGPEASSSYSEQMESPERNVRMRTLCALGKPSAFEELITGCQI